MSEEEKKALEEFKKWLQYEKNNKDKIDRAEELIKIQTTILNLIDKLQKERDIYYYECKTLEADLINNDIIPKDKIREKIKEVENKKENYIFKNLTSEDIRRTIITNYKKLLEEK